MIRRQAVRICIAVLAGGLVLCACSGDSQPRAAASPPPSGGTASVSTVVPASPSAAGITTLPQTPSGSATPGGDAQSAASLLRRVALFPTDLPAGMSGQPPVVEAPVDVSQRADNPGAFIAGAVGWKLVESSRSAFEGRTASPGPLVARSGAMLFVDDDGARGFMASLRDSVDAALAVIRMPGNDAPLAIAQVDRAEKPAVGDDALAWQFRSEGPNGAPASIVAFRRGRIVGMVATLGGGDAVALARILDGRAVEALR